MTQPRLVQPRMLVMITRRTANRTQLFRPDPVINNMYLYLLAVTSQKYGVGIIAPGLLSTHEHIIAQVVDETQLGDFLRDLHRLMALCTKVHRKWKGPVWDHEQTSVVHLRTPEAVVDKIAYVMVNPVAATLVARAERWPGVGVAPGDLGRRVLVATRPVGFLQQDDDRWPPQVTLSLTLPEEVGMDVDTLRHAVGRRLCDLEQQARNEAKRAGRTFLGVRGARRASPYARATSAEPIRKRNPTFAVGRGNRRAHARAVEELRAFRRAYRRALCTWREGVRDVVFPAGTLLMRTLHGVRVAPS